MSGKSNAMLSVRIPTPVKAEIDALAAKLGISTSDYVRKYWETLLNDGKVIVDEDKKVNVVNPNWPGPYRPPGGGGYPQGGYYNYPVHAPAGFPQQQDEMDKFLSELRKMAIAQMFTKFIQGTLSPEQLVQRAGGGGSSDSLPSVETIMKYKMLGKEDDSTKQMQMLMMQMMASRAAGDKGGENKATELMVALMANQSNQSSNFLNQFMASQQAGSTQTRDFFTAALGASAGNSDKQRTADNQHNQTLMALQGQIAQSNQAMMSQMFNQQLGWAQMEMQRIKDSKDKSPVDQLAALVELRDTNPVYKAAFNAVMGVKEESMLGKIIPQLKEMGLDKVIENVGGALAGMVMKPKIPAPATISSPMPMIPGMPPQMETPSGPPVSGITGLEHLRLPTMPGETPTETQPQTEQSATDEFTPTPNAPPETFTVHAQDIESIGLPPEATGYTNLNRPQDNNKEENKKE
uniref:Uncharacterized protein n=1 Tax=viral metagenome TaxID=1070528 RepID=A0A6M3IDQ7_9ZZZZ